MRIMEVNLNLRTERNKQPMDYFISESVSKTLCDVIPAADIYAMVEYMKCENELFLKQFTQNGYTLFDMIDKKQRGILVAVRNLVAKKVYELASPHLLHLRVESVGQNIDLIVMRILVGHTLSEKEFKDRRAQFLRALEYIATLCTQNVIVLGDFNNANIRDNYDGYVQKSYNYQFIIEEFNKIGLRLIPIDGYSHKGYLKEDHIILGNAFTITKAEYNDKLFNSNDDTIGYPDHQPLVADIEIKQ